MISNKKITKRSHTTHILYSIRPFTVSNPKIHDLFWSGTHTLATINCGDKKGEI